LPTNRILALCFHNSKYAIKGSTTLEDCVAIGVPLRKEDRILATLSKSRFIPVPDFDLCNQQVPNATTTSHGERARFPVAGLALQELQHGFWIGASQPFEFGHLFPPLRLSPSLIPPSKKA
jgi:hypothetical protein